LTYINTYLQDIQKLYLINMSQKRDVYVIVGRESFEKDFEDVDKLLDTSDQSSIYVFISPNYFTSESQILQDNNNVFRLVEPISNVFPPEWRQSSTEYTPLRWLMYSDEANVFFCTFNEEIFINMDYFMHIYNFENKTKILFTEDGKMEEEKLDSRIFQPETVQLGKAHRDVYEAAGYDNGMNGPVPGWCLQSGNPWLARVADLHRLRIENAREAVPFHDYDNLDKISYALDNPLIHDSYAIGRDLRMSVTESSATRKHLYELTMNLLDRARE
jgi:hypothetical protein